MSQSQTIKVSAPSRIHFGLFGGRNDKGVSFGGLGAMVDHPGIEITLEADDQFSFAGPQQERLREFVEAWIEQAKLDSPEQFRLELVQSPASHVGLGTGTQLGMAISAALFQFYFGEIPSIEKVAQFAQRGLRSGVGIYGFLHGGFIVDRGREPDQELPQLDIHLTFPQDWRIVLMQLRSTPTFFGQKEVNVFEGRKKLDLISKRNRLIEIANEKILPALLHADFGKFAESIFEFGKTSGSYFSSIQGGPFNGKRITEIIDLARQHEITGVGQSSWGPTVYALASSEEHANQIVELLSVHLHDDEPVIISKPSLSGATVSVFENTSSNS